MRNIVALFTSSLFVLFAAMLQTDIGWWLAGLGCLASILARILGEQERNIEAGNIRRGTVQEAISLLEASDERDQERASSARD